MQDKNLERIYPLDWRYSAAIAGLNEFFKYIKHEKDKNCNFNLCDEYFEYDKKFITPEYYEDFISYRNDKEKQIYKDFIDSKKSKVIYKKNEDENKGNNINVCRLRGFKIDESRKSKSISYFFNYNTYVGKDSDIFNFIPFAFISLGNEYIFINASYSLNTLCYINRNIKENLSSKLKNQKNLLIDCIDYLNYNTEIIVIKKYGKRYKYFETLYIKKESLNILKSNKLNFDNFEDNELVLHCILDLLRCDFLINKFMKNYIEKNKGEKEDTCRISEYINKLIKINIKIIDGGEELEKNVIAAKKCANDISIKLDDNKRNAYIQKLINSIIFNDYDKCCKIMLQLFNYAGKGINTYFMYELIGDVETNKDIIYSFINGLISYKKEGESCNE